MDLFDIILILILIVICLIIVIFAAVLVVSAIAYCYWALSIGMAPVLWLLMIIGAVVGFVCAVRNALKAARAIRDEKRR